MNKIKFFILSTLFKNDSILRNVIIKDHSFLSGDLMLSGTAKVSIKKVTIDPKAFKKQQFTRFRTKKGYKTVFKA